MRFALLLAATVAVVPAALTSPLPVVSSSPGAAALPLGVETGGTVETDRAALMAFYAAADGPNWEGETNWGSDEPLGTWRGVTIDEDGRVIGLRLSGGFFGLGEGLKGALPPALGDLGKLQTLYLSNSQLGGPIPAELGNLTNLQALILANNQLSGPIPASLGDLGELRVLFLAGNELSGAIPPELANLANLESLILDNNQLSGAIPSELGDLANLQHLGLAANQLSGPIPPSLGNLANLQVTRLAGNLGLTGCVPRSLRRLLVSPVSGRTTHDFIEVDANRDGNFTDALRGDVAGLGLPFCMLRDLRVGGATLDPPFVADIATYQASLHNGVSAVVVTATLINDHARVGIRKGGRSYANGELVPLDPGLNSITIEVAPLDATPWQSFTVEVTRPPGPPSWPLREGSDIVAFPGGASTTASRLFSGTDVELAFKYDRATRVWDDFYFTALDIGGFDVEPADILWVLAKQDHTLTLEGRPAAAPPTPGDLKLMLRGGGDMVVVPAGSPTTAARLFASTDVEAVWKYNRRTRAWDLRYRPARDAGAGFLVEPGDILWAIAERDLVVGRKNAPSSEPRIADPAIEVSVSRGHSCALRESGAIVCWGLNDRGQADAPPGRYRSVSAGWSHTCALRESGEIACWGSNRNGESDPPPGKYIAVGAAYLHSCALRESGEVLCWGTTGYDRERLPSGSYHSLSVVSQRACALTESGEAVCWAAVEAPAPPGTYRSVSTGRTFNCAVRESGELACWRWYPYQQPDPHPPGKFRSVSVGRGFACGVLESGKLVCWGDNLRAVTQVPEGRYVSVSAGEYHACAVRESGAVACWGGSQWDYGQSDAPTGRYQSVSAGEWHSCAVTVAGEIECWGSGSNAVGQPIAPPGQGYRSVSVGVGHSCAIRESGELHCWGKSSPLDAPPGRYESVRVGEWYSCGVQESGETVCWGSVPSWRDDPVELYRDLRPSDRSCERQESGEVECPDGSEYSADGSPAGRYLSVSVARWHTCALLESGKVACWKGGTESGGRAAWLSRPEAVPPDLSAPLLDDDGDDSALGALVIDAGTSHTCVLQASGEVLCWGKVGTTGELVPLPKGPYRSTSVGGEQYTCGVQTSGAVVCAGIHNASFNQAPGEDRYQSVSAGDRHACAFRESGELDCWGSNRHGQAMVPSGHYSAVSAGAFHTCAVLESGPVVCWGRNDHGQAVGRPGQYESVSAGSNHNCALGDSGKVVCWGNNDSGQTDMPAGRFLSVSAGGAHTCALRESGEMVCWGSNESGQSDVPPGRYQAVTAGGLHTCAMRDTGEVVCWGGNEHGQTSVPSLLAGSGTEQSR